MSYHHLLYDLTYVRSKEVSYRLQSPVYNELKHVGTWEGPGRPELVSFVVTRGCHTFSLPIPYPCTLVPTVDLRSDPESTLDGWVRPGNGPESGLRVEEE